MPGVRGVRSPFEALDPDALTPERARARGRGRSHRDPALAQAPTEDASLLVATGEHPWRSAAAAEVLERRARRSAPGPRGDDRRPDRADGRPQAHTLRDYGCVAAVLVVGWNFLMLLFAFRSVVVPIKAVLMNVISLGASYGLLVWVFQDGHLASLLGFEPLEGIDPTIPLVMFAVVFGLSMDYEVFLLSRIREEWLRTRDNQQSVISGLAHTGRIITSAALILLVVIGAFAAGTLVYVQADRRRHRRGDRARRDAGARAAGPRHHAAARRLELVGAALAAPAGRRACAAAGRALPAGGRSHPFVITGGA